jgi:hypothetical protein
MNLLNKTLTMALILTISLQSQAMLKNFASRLATRMPATMMRNFKIAMPKFSQRTFATAKPAAKSLWAKPIMARAAMLGGLGTATAFATMGAAKAEGVNEKNNDKNEEELQAYFEDSFKKYQKCMQSTAPATRAFCQQMYIDDLSEIIGWLIKKSSKK